MKLLLIEDDKIITNLLIKGFTDSGFEIENTFDGKLGFELAIKNKYDLIILDLMLPTLDGVSILKELRASNLHIPIIILSAKETVEDIVKGLGSGADDYLVKPFSFNELLARANSLVRRAIINGQNNELKIDNLVLNITNRECRRNNKLIELHLNEFTLLKYMLENKDNVISKSQILLKVWGYEFDPQTNVVDVLICRLRNKIDRDFDDKLIHTLRGAGYVVKKN